MNGFTLVNCHSNANIVTKDLGKIAAGYFMKEGITLVKNLINASFAQWVLLYQVI